MFVYYQIYLTQLVTSTGLIKPDNVKVVTSLKWLMRYFARLFFFFMLSFNSNSESDSDSSQFIDADEGSGCNDCFGMANEIF